MVKYTLGCFKNEKDERDVKLASVQMPIALPSKFITDISMIPVFAQKSIGCCVGCAHALINIYHELLENKVVKALSPRYIYALCKREDGIPSEGTSPRVAADIQLKKGCSTEEHLVNNTDLTHAEYINITETTPMTESAGLFKVKGYAAVATTLDGLKQAIVLNGLVTITISVGNYDNPIRAGYGGLYHRIVLWGFETLETDTRFYFRNSWGPWGIDNSGNGYFDYKTHEGHLWDAMVFIDLPKEVIEEAKKGYKHFKKQDIEALGIKPDFARMLDNARGIAKTPFLMLNNKKRGIFKYCDINRGAKNYHMLGRAVDITFENKEQKLKIVKGCKEIFRRVIIHKSYVHVDNAIM